MATVNLIDVSKQIGKTPILDKVCLDIHKGEFVVVVGPSGCGKSTLLRLIAGLDSPSGGQILINNQCVNHIPAAKRDMAMVFQSYALYPHMTVFDNMAYGLKMRGVAKESIFKKVTDIAQLLQLTDYLNRKPQALSGGQKQRVAMGRALVRSPSVFLFDEPLSNLDAKLRTEMRQEIRRLHQKFNTTSLYVTHDQTEAMTMAERVIVLNKGTIEQIGTPQDLYQSPASFFVAGFTGQYPINVLAGTFHKSSQSIETQLGIHFPIPQGHEQLADKTELTLAIRPEHAIMSHENHPETIAVKVEFVDDMGADKLIQAISVKTGERFNLRVHADFEVSSGQIHVALPKMKLHVFNQQTGKRLGGRL